MDAERRCVRCGEIKDNPSRLCYGCCRKFVVYVAQHPLSNYDNITIMKKENVERWNDFISEGKKK